MAMFGAKAPNPFAYPTAQPYQETPRDKLANLFLKAAGDNYGTRRAARNMFGSSGIGGGSVSPLGGLLDMTPAGIPYQLNEAGAKIGRGQTLGGLLDAALAVAPIPAVAKKGARMGKLLAGGERAAEKGITAYHGSPHTFDQFDTAKIGTGKGNQAYGNGLYFAEQEATAKGYRDTPQLDRSTGFHNIDVELASVHGGDWEAFKAAHRDPPPALRQAIAKIDEDGPPRITPGGSMYQVRINADPESFLDWEKRLDQHPPEVQAALNRAAGEFRPGHKIPMDDRRGSSAYADMFLLSGRSGLDAYPAASAAMQKAGIPGVKYLDGGDRGAGAQNYHNYVVFDPKIISIMKRYGVTGPVAAMIAAGQMKPPPEQSN